MALPLWMALKPVPVTHARLATDFRFRAKPWQLQ
jgi:hypothetical protein